jgi:hypothetical protein
MPSSPEEQEVASALKILVWMGRSPWRILVVVFGAPVLFFFTAWLKLWAQGSLNSWSSITGHAALALTTSGFFVAFAVVLLVAARRPRR